ncbi:MAG: tetratricopeptide repeat protein [Bacteriovoracaceae bacterium]
MTSRRNQSALLAKYHQLYQKNPRSKVFAPLAESYRKLGMIEDALKILREGIKSHPSYPLGYIVLSHCYFDQQKFELCYNTLRPLVGSHQDNISLQKLFAQTCLQISHLDEALETYKYLLFMNPRDKFFAEQVTKLEADLYQSQKIISQEKLIKAPDLILNKNLSSSFDDDWVQVDFANKNETPSPFENTSRSIVDDEWVMQKPGGKSSQENESTADITEFTPMAKLSLEDLPEDRNFDDDYYADEFEEYGDIEEVNASELTTDEPIISHTLIELYSAQKYYDKAIELLDKILHLNPGDAQTIQKRNEILNLKNQVLGHDSTEEEGHQELISLIETKVKAKTPEQEKLEKVFDRFLHLVQKKAQEARPS